MELVPLLLPPLFGAVIGLVTNALAIRMLFRPYREVRVLGVRFHGTIPRRQGDIARTVSGVVTSELLREEQVAQRVAGPEVRSALRQLALSLADRYRARLRGSVSALLAPDQLRAAERFGERLVADLAAMAARWLESDAGRAAVAAWVERVLELSPGELLEGEEVAARRALSARVEAVLADPALEQRVRPAVVWALVRLAGTDRTLGELLPSQLQEALRGVVRRTVPVLLQRFEAALLAPANVARLKRAVRAGIRTYLAETDGGVVKNLIRQAALFGQERLLREADQVVDSNLHRLRDLVYEEGNRARVEEGVAQALAGLLRQTPSQVMASLPAETVAGAHDTLTAWATGYLRRAETGRFVSELLEGEVERVFRTPLRELVEAAEPEGAAGEAAARRWAEVAVRWLVSGGLEGLAAREAPTLVCAVLRTPLGPQLGLLSPAVVAEVVDLALDQALPVLARKVPEVLRIVDVQGLIEREIRAFSPEEVEGVILAVARRELRAITWWGAGLGGLVGGAQSLLQLLGR